MNMRKAFITVAAVLTLGLAGCGPEPDMPMRQRLTAPDAVQPLEQQRIQITRIGVFRDELAYNSRRGVYVITDAKSGKEYIGISGIGIQETGSHMAGKTPVSDER